MNLKNLFPLIDVEEIHTDTDHRAVNALLRQGWSLLLVYSSPDGLGGFYAVYVLGKHRPMADRTFTDRNEFDQRVG